MADNELSDADIFGAPKTGGELSDAEIFGTASHPSVGQMAVDVAKQIPAGIAAGVEAMPGIMPTIMGAAGHGLEAGIRKLGLESPEVAAQIKAREQLKNIPSKNLWSLSSNLPAPQTTAGEYARTAGEFLPAALAGPGSLARRITTQGIVPAVASEAAGQTTKGTEAEPYARIGAAAVSGFPFGRWRTSPTPAPVVDDLYDAGTHAYKQIQESGFALKPVPFADLATKIESDLTKRGFSDRSVPETFGILRDMQDVRNAPSGASITASNLDTARQQLRQASLHPSNFRESAAANSAISQLDNYLINVPDHHVASGDAKAVADLFAEARGDWAAAKRVEMVSGKLGLGELNAATAHSGMNVDNATRQAVKQLIRPDKYGKTLAEKHGFNDVEIGLMNDVAKGTASVNVLRYVGNLLGGGGGFGQLAVAGIGAGTAYETKDPKWLALPAIGAAARYTAGKLTQAQAQRLLGATASRSPLGRAISTDVIPSQKSQLLGAGALRAGTLLEQKRGGLVRSALGLAKKYGKK